VWRASTADDDAALVHAARHGDRSAFAVLVDRHLDLVRSLCVRWLADPTVAEDAVQDAVLAAMTSLDKLNRPASFGPWLAGIALNTARSLARQQSRSPISLEVVLGGRWIAEPRDAGPGPDTVVENRLLARRLTEVVASLPVGQAAAITAFYLQGLSIAETAEHLGVSVTAVKNRLYKARESLRRSVPDLAVRPTMEEPAMETESAGPIPMQVTAVRRVDREGDVVHIVVLSDAEGGHTLPIWVGAAEATSLALALDGAELPRPSTYQLTVALLAAAGGRIEAVEIVGLTAGVFYARLALADGSTVDARPSDALNIAVLVNAPVRVHPEVVTAANGSSRRPAPGPSDHPAIAAEAMAALAALVRTEHRGSGT
jgi:RNA polymerase sigma factor (sigma-70 family)